MIRSWQSASKRVAVPCKGTENRYESRYRKAYIAVWVRLHRQKIRAVIEYPDVVIRLTRKARQVGRRIVAAAVSPLWVSGVTAVVEVGEPVYQGDDKRNQSHYAGISNGV